MNVCRTHKATNACISELLHLFSKVILPSPNSLPGSEGVATSMLRRLGLKYDTIDACKNGCVLFRGEYADMEACPLCNAPKYKRVGMSSVPNKVLRHFPLIPRLRRMFSTPHMAALMTWHSNNTSKDGKMRGPFDSPQWDHIRARHAGFEADSRNIHLGLCADGLNPHSQKRSTHSLCPVLLLNYNIPPWLTIKNFFIMLGLLIPGPDAITADRIDVFLSPLIEELKQLWEEGVICYDAARWRGEVRFTLRAILMWCIHDFPAYAMLAGTTNKGYCACPVCGPNTPSRYSDHLSKVVYGGKHRRWLPADHPFRFDVSVFSSEEVECAPGAMDAASHIRWAYMRAEYARFGGRLGGEGDPVLQSGVKRLPMLYTLPYWKVHHSDWTFKAKCYRDPQIYLMVAFMCAGHADPTCAGCNAHREEHSGVCIEISFRGERYTRDKEGFAGCWATTRAVAKTESSQGTVFQATCTLRVNGYGEEAIRGTGECNTHPNWIRKCSWEAS